MKLAALRLCAVGALAALSLGAAQAGTLNFIDITQNTSTGLGESAWTTLNLTTTDSIGVSIKGYHGTQAAFAYLDWGNAGLGVCKKLITNAPVNTARKGNGGNICDPSSDDNTTVDESLSFVFDQDVFVKMWFNNNHDGGFDLGDKVSIAGTAYDVATGYAGGVNGIGLFQVRRGTELRVAYANEEFYMSGMQILTSPPTDEPRIIQVPEPGSLALAGLALLGLGVARRRG